MHAIIIFIFSLLDYIYLHFPHEHYHFPVKGKAQNEDSKMDIPETENQGHRVQTNK
jgi:hypothetical protein